MVKARTAEKTATSFRLTPEAHVLLDALAERQGVPGAAALEVLLREEGERRQFTAKELAGARRRVAERRKPRATTLPAPPPPNRSTADEH